MKKYFSIYIILPFFIMVFIGCKKLIEIDSPPNQLTDDKVFSTEGNINAALVNMYTVFNAIDVNFIAQSGVYSDELAYNGTDPGTLEYVPSILSITNNNVSNVWNNYYLIIYQSNLLIEGLLKYKSSVADSIKAKAIAEAKFLRAYSYFNLVNIYGEVPLITFTNVGYTSIASRTLITSVYQQILTDLKDAEARLSIAYSGIEKIRPNKYAASALLARVYLYIGDWINAENKATFVIQSGIYDTALLNKVFLKNSNEAIWQLWNQDGFSNLGSIFIPASGRPTYSILDNMLNSLESSDQRKVNWIKSTTVSGVTYFYPYKYKNRSTTTGASAEYTMKLRLGEMYLIRAEARAMQNAIQNAVNDINVIRSRAGLLSILMPITKDSSLHLIEKERRVELFAEEGNRFYDLKRTNQIDAILGLLKFTWQPTAKLYPVPQIQRIVNPALTQNPGY